MTDELRIPVLDFSVTASVHGRGDTVVCLAHGAGSTRRTPFLLRLAEDLAASGRRAVLYNYPYSDAGRRAPDAPDVLEKTADSVARYARARLGAARVVLGGKSMGGRIASQAVAAGTAAEALVFLGYPLHPPGRTDVLRDRHFPKVGVPMLFVQGTRDAFARPDLLQSLLERLGSRAELFRVEDGDHSFAVRKRSGRTSAEAEAEVRRAVVGWLEARRL
jgi:uncharacterized protein